MTSAGFFLLGAVSGYVQALALRRAAQRGGSPLAFWARLLLVGAVLALAAMLGQILAAALGWGGGYFVSAAFLARGFK
jgi:hypothetical protein